MHKHRDIYYNLQFCAEIPVRESNSVAWHLGFFSCANVNEEKQKWLLCLCITKKQMLTQFLINNLGLGFLMSDEYKKGFLSLRVCAIFTCFFFPLSSHLTFLSPFPLYFFLTDTWFQFIFSDLFSFIFINSCSLYILLFLAPIYVAICIHCKKGVVL